MLRGKNILLRSLKDTDINILEIIENDRKNWKFGSENKIYKRQELRDYIKKSKTPIHIAKQYRFVIELLANPIGFIDLFNYKNDSAEVGVIILNQFRSKGLATEALNLIIEYSFNTLQLNHLHCSINKKNISSVKLFTNCGFVLREIDNDLQYFIKLAK